MKRLVVTIKTDLQTPGAFFELSGDTPCEELLQILAKDIELSSKSNEEPNNFSDYHFMKIQNKPIEIKNDQTLNEAGIENGDTLLVYLGDYIHSGMENFAFEPLMELSGAEQSPQEFRAPMRMPSNRQMKNSSPKVASIPSLSQDSAQDELIAEQSPFKISPHDEANLKPRPNNKGKNIPKKWKEVDID